MTELPDWMAGKVEMDPPGEGAPLPDWMVGKVEMDRPAAAPGAAPQEEEGFLDATLGGLMQSARNVGQTAQTAVGATPEFAPDTASYAQPIEWELGLPSTSALKKAVYQVAASAPELVGGVLGAGIGAGVGSLASPVGTVVGGIGGGGLGSGAGAFLNALGPYYAEELQRNPDPNAAYEVAWDRALASGAFSALGGVAAGALNPFKSVVKNFLLGTVATQPAIGVGEQVAQNVLTDRPALEGAGEAYLNNMILGAATEGAIRGADAAFGAPEAGTTPSAAPGQPGAVFTPWAGEAAPITVKGETATPTGTFSDGRVLVEFEDGSTAILSANDFKAAQGPVAPEPLPDAPVPRERDGIPDFDEWLDEDLAPSGAVEPRRTPDEAPPLRGPREDWGETHADWDFPESDEHLPPSARDDDAIPPFAQDKAESGKTPEPPPAPELAATPEQRSSLLEWGARMADERAAAERVTKQWEEANAAAEAVGATARKTVDDLDAQNREHARKLTEEIAADAAQGRISKVQADVSTWLLSHSPQFARTLAGIRAAKPEGKAASGATVGGYYDPVSRIIGLVTRNATTAAQQTADARGALHEIMHHSERLLPDSIRQGVVQEYQNRIKARQAKAAPDAKVLYNTLLSSSDYRARQKAAVELYRLEGGKKFKDYYEMVSPSEFWAENAATYLNNAYAKRNSWATAARDWLASFVGMLRDTLGPKANPAVLDGLDHLLGTRWPGARHKPWGSLIQHEPSAGRINQLTPDDVLAPTPRMDADLTAAAKTLSGMKTKFLNVFESNSLASFILPRTLAALDYFSSKYWNTLKSRDTLQHQLADKYRRTLPAYQRLTAQEMRNVSAAQELLRLHRARFAPALLQPGVPLVNTNFARAEHTKPGGVIRLTAREAEAAQQHATAMQSAWTDTAEAIALRDGWTGPIDPAAIRNHAATLTGGEKLKFELLAATVEAMQRQASMFYVPFSHGSGDYGIVIRDKLPGALGGMPPTVYFETLASETSLDKLLGRDPRAQGVPKTAAAKIKELEKKYPRSQYDYESFYLIQKPDALRDIGIPAIEKLLMLMQTDISNAASKGLLSGNSDPAHQAAIKKFYDQMIDSFRKQVYEELQSGSRKQSRNIAGYNPDFAQATGKYLNWVSNYAADTQYKDRIAQALDDIKTSHPSEKVKTYWDKYNAAQEAPETPALRAVRAVKRGAFLYALGFNPVSAGLNLISDAPMVAAEIGTVAGNLKAFREIGYGTNRLLASARFDEAGNLIPKYDRITRTADELDLLESLENEGRLHPAGTDDVSALAASGLDALSPTSRRLRQVYNASAAMLGATDRSLRAAAGLTAYRAAKAPGGMQRVAKVWGVNQVWRAMAAEHGATPDTYARFVLDHMIGMADPRNRPHTLSGPLGQMAAQFKTYMISALSRMLYMSRHAGPEGKVAAGLMLATIASTGGALAMPFAEDILGLAEWAYKKLSGEDEDMQTSLDSFIRDNLGDTAGDMFMYGPLATLTGVDLASRVGYGDLVTGTGFDPLQLLGAAPSIAVNAVSRTLDRAASGQSPSAIIAEASPTVLKNLITGAAVYDDQGVQTAKGKTIVAPEDLSTGDAIRKAIGFQPLSVVKEYRKGDAIYRLRTSGAERYKATAAQVSNLYTRALRARRRGDLDEAKRLRDAARAIQKRAMENGVITDATAFRRAIQDRMQAHQDPHRALIESVPDRKKPEARKIVGD